MFQDTQDGNILQIFKNIITYSLSCMYTWTDTQNKERCTCDNSRTLFKKLGPTHRFVLQTRVTPGGKGKPEARAWTNLQQQCQSHWQNRYVIRMNGNTSPCQFVLPPRNYLSFRFQRIRARFFARLICTRARKNRVLVRNVTS